MAAARNAIDDLRSSGAIGDHAYRRAEEELDWLDLSARATEASKTRFPRERRPTAGVRFRQDLDRRAAH